MPGDIYQAEPARPLPAEEAREQQQAHQQQNDGGSVAPSLPNSTSTPTTASSGRPRTATGAAEIDETLSHPGSVRINVKGAFIVDQESATPTSTNGRSGSPGHHETKDIRLPNHTAVVSHIAIDVRSFSNPFPPLLCSAACCRDDVIMLATAKMQPPELIPFFCVSQIGGSLAKLVYFSREAHSAEPGGRLNFLSFETDHIDECLEFMRNLKYKHQRLNGGGDGSSSPRGTDLCVMATGGGAYKYYDKIRDVLGVDVLREDEMECLIIGKKLISMIQSSAELLTGGTQALTSSSQRYPVKSSPTPRRIRCNSFRLRKMFTLTYL
jgi:type II pantothenate kinase